MSDFFYMIAKNKYERELRKQRYQMFLEEKKDDSKKTIPYIKETSGFPPKAFPNSKIVSSKPIMSYEEVESFLNSEFTEEKSYSLTKKK